MTELEKHMQIITANTSPSAPHAQHRTFTQLFCLFYCPNYKHTCNSFLPAPKFPTKSIGRAERENHNDVITSTGSQDTLKRKQRGWGVGV